MKLFGRTGFFARINMVDTCENHENSFLRGLAGAGGQGRVSGRATGPPERAYAPAFATDLSPAIRLLPAGLAEPGAAGGGAGIVAGGMPVKVVATSLGFKQAAHFCRHFKRLHQRTPTEFVVLHRPEAAKVAFGQSNIVEIF